MGALLARGVSHVCDRLLSPAALRQGKRRLAVALGALLSGTIVLTPYVGSITLASVVPTTSPTFNTFAQSMNFALTNDRLRTTGDVGRAYAFFTLGGISFGIMGPIVTGYLVSLTGDFMIAPVLCRELSLLAAILVTTLTRLPTGESVKRNVAWPDATTAEVSEGQGKDEDFDMVIAGVGSAGSLRNAAMRLRFRAMSHAPLHRVHCPMDCEHCSASALGRPHPCCAGRRPKTRCPA